MCKPADKKDAVLSTLLQRMVKGLKDAEESESIEHVSPISSYSQNHLNHCTSVRYLLLI